MSGSAAAGAIYGAATVPGFDPHARGARSRSGPVIIDTHPGRLDSNPGRLNSDMRCIGARRRALYTTLGNPDFLAILDSSHRRTQGYKFNSRDESGQADYCG
jgi:hypothetical protein